MVLGIDVLVVGLWFGWSVAYAGYDILEAGVAARLLRRNHALLVVCPEGFKDGPIAITPSAFASRVISLKLISCF